VLRGEAGARLLDTYAAERQPVAELTVARQTANYVERMRPDRNAEPVRLLARRRQVLAIRARSLTGSALRPAIAIARWRC
jgi:hypothetical protein